jgi:hypothetical protein
MFVAVNRRDLVAMEKLRRAKAVKEESARLKAGLKRTKEKAKIEREEAAERLEKLQRQYLSELNGRAEHNRHNRRRTRETGSSGSLGGPSEVLPGLWPLPSSRSRRPTPFRTLTDESYGEERTKSYSRLDQVNASDVQARLQGRQGSQQAKDPDSSYAVSSISSIKSHRDLTPGLTGLQAKERSFSNDSKGTYSGDSRPTLQLAGNDRSHPLSPLVLSYQASKSPNDLDKASPLMFARLKAPRPDLTDPEQLATVSIASRQTESLLKSRSKVHRARVNRSFSRRAPSYAHTPTCLPRPIDPGHVLLGKPLKLGVSAIRRVAGYAEGSAQGSESALRKSSESPSEPARPRKSIRTASNKSFLQERMKQYYFSRVKPDFAPTLSENKRVEREVRVDWMVQPRRRISFELVKLEKLAAMRGIVKEI